MQKQFSLMDNTHPYKNKLPINMDTRFDCNRYIVFISTHTTTALLLHELTQISKSSLHGNVSSKHYYETLTILRGDMGVQAPLLV